MSKTVELYYDFSSPNAYFSALQLPAIAEKHGATIVYKPIFLGGLFKAIGTGMTPGMSNSLKAEHNTRDMVRWGEKYGIPFSFPSRFPLNTVKPLRIAIALLEGSGDHDAFMTETFRAYWAKDRDVSDEAVLREIVGKLGVDADGLLAKTLDPAIKEKLKTATQEAEYRRVFGAPTFIVGGELYWGKDRLDFVEDALAK